MECFVLAMLNVLKYHPSIAALDTAVTIAVAPSNPWKSQLKAILRKLGLLRAIEWIVKWLMKLIFDVLIFWCFWQRLCSWSKYDELWNNKFRTTNYYDCNNGRNYQTIFNWLDGDWPHQHRDKYVKFCHLLDARSSSRVYSNCIFFFFCSNLGLRQKIWRSFKFMIAMSSNVMDGIMFMSQMCVLHWNMKILNWNLFVIRSVRSFQKW